MRRMPEPPGSNRMALQLACDLAETKGAADSFGVFLASHRCPDREILDCKLALVEACNNAIQHAGPEAKELPILLRASCTSSLIEIRVTDHTPGFDWPEFTLPDPQAERGRGLCIIRLLMDECRYERGPNGNTLTLRKRRSSI